MLERRSSDLKTFSPLRASMNATHSPYMSVALRRESKLSSVPEEDIEVDWSQSVEIRETKPRSAMNRTWRRITRPFLKKSYHRKTATSDEASIMWKIRDALLCPPHGMIAHILTGILAIFVGYGILVVLTKEDASPLGYRKCIAALTKNITNNTKEQKFRTTHGGVDSSKEHKRSPCVGSMFGLYVIFVCALIAGAVLRLINVPPLLGMLLVGVGLRNIPGLQVARLINKSWFGVLRNLALVVILTRAGLCLDPDTLKRLSAAVFRLAFVPCIVETCTAAVASHFLLKFSWDWGFMLGFVLGAVSPAVVVLSMLKLEAMGYGVAKGIPTLVIAAASMDDVLAITGFSFALGIAFQQQESKVWVIFKGPVEALCGILFGVVAGVLLWFVPNQESRHIVFYRTFFLISGGTISLLGSNLWKFPGAGALGCLSLTFVAGLGWRKRDKWDEENNPVIPMVDFLWWFAEPMLFGLIGAELDIQQLRGKTVLLGLAVLAIGLVMRMIGCFFAVFGIGLTLREKLFIPFAWLPKATVQAAIGPVALDTAELYGFIKPQYAENGRQILTIAAISILITAPLGAILIALLGPRMLSRANVDMVMSDSEFTSTTQISLGKPDAGSHRSHLVSHTNSKELEKITSDMHFGNQQTLRQSVILPQTTEQTSPKSEGKKTNSIVKEEKPAILNRPLTSVPYSDQPFDAKPHIREKSFEKTLNLHETVHSFIASEKGDHCEKKLELGCIGTLGINEWKTVHEQQDVEYICSKYSLDFARRSTN